ncbi:unnamed protein product [Commensalibacter papalotli (ex Botero et al. 2024)]|uniref:Uncharacterized protein n=1 Tax=Commensalibacter papalotli (ex Botero et al. 2024) TaxID=2972766 RepID=A0ABM9HJ50_9PROT|nr:unnamed protein product [Commensalibacter papalotli (ex Botero et al. 2024)]CAI3926729.1 unnamed protein product [Commensalibacter papalotli (ex Botero et al. 2024)]
MYLIKNVVYLSQFIITKKFIRFYFIYNNKLEITLKRNTVT